MTTSVALGEVAGINPVRPALIPVDERVAFVRMASVSEAGSMEVTEYRVAGQLEGGYSYFRSGDVLLAKITPCFENNKITIAEVDTAHGFGSTEFHVIRPNIEALDRRYLMHFLRQDMVRELGARRMTGSAGQRRVPRQFLEELMVPIPPLNEQRRLAAILDQADDLRRKRRLALEKLNALPQAIFQEMFGDPIANPKGSPTELLGSLCRLVRGSSPRPQGDPLFFGGPVPRLMIADVTRDGMVVYPKIDSLTLEGARRSRPLSRGTVVMAVSGAVGLPAILGIDACIHDGFVGFPDLDERISPSYLYYWLQSQRRLNSSRAPGAIWTNLTTDQVSAFSIAIPPRVVQASFENRITSLFSIVTDMAMHEKKLDDLFASLQHHAFVDTLDPSSAAATLASLQRINPATPLAV